MTYEDFVEELSGRVDHLSPRSRAAVFWLVGTGLRSGLSVSEGADWADWFDDASRLSIEFITEGSAGSDLQSIWERALAPTGPEATQLLNSTIICLSSPLAIAIDPTKHVGPWIEHALFPVVQAVSLDLFEDIAFPDEDDLNEVFADARVQAAGRYCVSICESLAAGLPLEWGTLEGLSRGATILNGVW